MFENQTLNELLRIFLTIIISSGIITIYFKRRINLAIDERIQRTQNQREAFSKFLDIWYSRRDEHSDDWSKKLGTASKEMILWCPNEVIYHVGKYVELFGKSEAEYHFGSAVLCFRKTLGYKNRWWQLKKVTAKNIVDIYSVGDESVIK
jgi:hypothetical protein